MCVKPIAFTLTAGILLGAAAEGGGAEPGPETAEVVAGNTAFACDLYGRLRASEGNLIVSPYSISAALAMTSAGARGETAREMRAVLHFPSKRLHEAFHLLRAGLAPKGSELCIANRLWGQKGHAFLDSFLALTESMYGAKLEAVDFAAAPEKARERINAWVEEMTRRKIRDLLNAGDVDPSTTLVLTNAIHFKGRWAARFSVGDTRDAPFALLDGSSAQVPMMFRAGTYRHAGGGGARVLELPYEGGGLAMIILLPEGPGGLRGLERSLTPANLGAWLGGLREERINVYVPRFGATTRFSLAEDLSAMGMRTAFSGAADFSGMTGKKDLFLSDVVHKAFVDVNEEGTEAAAATGVVMKRGLPREFRADRPFLYLISDTRSGSILFLGRVVDPRPRG